MASFALAGLLMASYLLSSYLGLAVTLIVFVIMLKRLSHSFLERLLRFSIVTMPLYMTPIVPSLPPLFSWTTIALIFLSLLFLVHRQKMGLLEIHSIVTFVLIGLFTALVFSPGFSGIYYFAQLVLFVIPIVLALQARQYFALIFDDKSQKRLLSAFTGTISAMALGVLIQWQLQSRVGIELGNISYFQSRTSYDLTIPAFSVLSGILSMGIVLGPVVWRNSSKISGILLPLLSASAILVNSSRTGLVAGSIVLMLIILFPPKGVKRGSSRLAIIPGAIFLWWLYEALINSSRFADSGEVFDDNGRLSSMRAGLLHLSENPVSILAGIGFNNQLGLHPHNFIVETVVATGLIVSGILLVWIGRIIFLIRGTDWFYILLSLLVSSMFFSGFYAVKAFTIVAVISVVITAVRPIKGVQPSLADSSDMVHGPDPREVDTEDLIWKQISG